MNIGDRVTVRVTPDKRDQWSTGALEVLQGHTGTVEEIKTHHDNVRERIRLAVPRYLVRFDPALPPLWTHASPTTAHWFDADEVELTT